ncbi:MAG: hypothetical protein ACK4GL_02400 [Flavobacteriales bacterium]
MNLFCLNDSAQLVWRYSVPVPSTLTCVPHELAITQQHIYVLWNFSGFEKESWYLQKFDFLGQHAASLSSDTTRNQRALWLLAQEHQLRIVGQERYQDLNKTFQILSDTSLSIIQSQSISFFNSHEFLADYLLYSDSARVYAINLESDSTGLDFAIAYQHEDSTQNWLFYYDGLAGYDDAISGLASIGRRLFAAGYTTKLENAQLHKDYLLLCLSDDGQIIWEAHYDGPPGQMDDAELQIATDELDRIWVSGASYNGMNYDMFTCVYDTEGSLLYYFRYALDGDKDERPFRMVKDKVGGMILAGKSERDSTSHILLRYGDEKEKQQAIEKQLALLAAALVLPMQDTLIKSIVWKYVEKSYTDLWYVFIDEIVRDAEALNYPILSEMNKSVSWFFDLPPKDYVSPLLKRFYVDGRPYRPFIYVVEADSLSRQQWMDSIPWIAFSHQRDSMPVMAVSRDRDTELPLFEPIDGVLEPWGGTNSRPILELAILPNDWVRRTERRLHVRCFIRKNELCQVCFDGDIHTPIEFIETINPGHFEILINQFTSDISPSLFECEETYNYVNYFPGYDVLTTESSLIIHNPSFLFIEGVFGNYSFYERKYFSFDNLFVKKFNRPILIKQPTNSSSLYEIDALTLCHPTSNMHDIGEFKTNINSGAHAGLGMGGIFKVSIPGQNMPLYFSFPYTKGIWFNDGPDMGVFYFVKNENNQNCENIVGNPQEELLFNKSIVVGHGGSAFVNSYETIYPDDPLSTRFIISHDYDEIKQYWEANQIKIGFIQGSNQLVNSLNLFVFHPDNEEVCSTTNYTLVAEFSVTEDGWYEVSKLIELSLGSNDNILIKVNAEFKNQEIINTCESVVLTGENLRFITVEITGNIKDYSNEDVVYQIQVFKND